MWVSIRVRCSGHDREELPVWPFGRRPRIEPGYGDAGAAHLRACLAARDWRAASEFFAALDDPDDRAFYYGQAGAVAGVQDWIPEWVSAEPRSCVPVLIAAQRYIARASSARPSSTSSDHSRLYTQRMQVADDLLKMAVDLDGDDPAPWAFLVTTARGLRLGETEGRRRFGEAVIRFRWHHAAHLELLALLSPAGGGSLDALHDLVRRTVPAMPEGSTLGVLTPYAHMEHWMSLRSRTYDYLRQPSVIADLNAAADRSVRHPAYRQRPGWPLIHNVFAWTFARAGDWRAATEQFEIIGESLTEYPWGAENVDAASSFAAARRTARRVR
jgi:hypothetical protein